MSQKKTSDDKLCSNMWWGILLRALRRADTSEKWGFRCMGGGQMTDLRPLLSAPIVVLAAWMSATNWRRQRWPIRRCHVRAPQSYFVLFFPFYYFFFPILWVLSYFAYEIQIWHLASCCDHFSVLNISAYSLFHLDFISEKPIKNPIKIFKEYSPLVFSSYLLHCGLKRCTWYVDFFSIFCPLQHGAVQLFIRPSKFDQLFDAPKNRLNNREKS